MSKTTRSSPVRSWPSSSREKAITDLAEFIADEHFPTNKVVPEAIAKAVGITVSYGAYGDAFDGLLEHKEGRFHIFCNLDRVETRSSPRARFTLGHELGHYFLDEHRHALESGRTPAHPSFCDFESKNPVEVEADVFASALLMPKNRFLKSANKLVPGLPGILQLAGGFGTSVTSTAVRYATLNVRPSVAVKWMESGYSWKWISDDFYRAGYRKTIEDPAALLEGSATWQALRGNIPAEKQVVESGTTGSAWFPFVEGGGYRDVVLIEQAMRLGRFGVLTILYPAEAGSLPRSSYLGD